MSDESSAAPAPGPKPEKPSNVHAPRAFQAKMDPEQLDRLKAMGIQFQDASGIDSLELAEPQHGEDVLGELTDEEKLLFVSFYHVNEELDTLQREIGGGLMEQIGRDVRTSREDKVYEVDKYIDPDAVKRFFALSAQRDLLKGNLFWSLGERFGCHDHSIGVRSKARAVRRHRKW